MNKYIIIVLSILLFSCQKKPKIKPNNFKTGKYKTVLDDDKITSFAVRNDSIQIETFENKNDTFHIKWINNFEYILLKKNPKTLLDSTPFHVKITAVKKDSYNFKAYYKGSKFKQKGSAFELD